MMKNDTNSIKQMNDCRAIIERDLGKPRLRSSDYLTYPCPFHHETNGESFVVYKDRWFCFGKCQMHGDVINWVQKRHNVTFREACLILQNPSTSNIIQATSCNLPPTRNSPQPPTSEWQKHAEKVVAYAQENLWNNAGKKALSYLMDMRGLSKNTIQRAQLGYIPAQTDIHVRYGRVLVPDWKKPNGDCIHIPCGWTIPHFANGNIWAVRVRREFNDPKYLGIHGGSKALYWSDSITLFSPILITEGEFDALIVDQCASDLISPVALASASNSHIHAYWQPKLIAAPLILTRMDSHQAGYKAQFELVKLSSRIKSIQVPPPFKDINDFYLGSGTENVRQWLDQALVSHQSSQINVGRA